MRHLLAALMAIGMVVRLGGGCEAMAAVPTMASVASSHCADMPAKPGKPVKVVATCALCVALPDATPMATEAIAFDAIGHASYSPVRMVGLAGGPAPPPPKIA